MSATPTAGAFLEVTGLEVAYGKITALRGASLTVDRGEIVTLIGANGAGKSTTVRTLAGLNRPVAGRVVFDGKDTIGQPPEEIVRRGLILAPEGRRIFPRMSVHENLIMGAYTRRDAGIKADIERAFTLFPRLKEREKQLAGSLSGGEQQMLAIGRALMAKPKLLMLDEPSLGLAPILVEQIFTIILEINSQGTTVLLVEQNAYKALEIAHRGYVLETGVIVQTGTGKELLASEDVQRAYLGM
ncbi:MAG TPA: ABC transporter ATP-binding protein [Candidatus Dormibacteraeota bacterium]|nr:ABC transporter ATP-binding protein [Candidatus Dormibacteraeota bacterium]